MTLVTGLSVGRVVTWPRAVTTTNDRNAAVSAGVMKEIADFRAELRAETIASVLHVVMPAAHPIAVPAVMGQVKAEASRDGVTAHRVANVAAHHAAADLAAKADVPDLLAVAVVPVGRGAHALVICHIVRRIVGL